MVRVKTKHRNMVILHDDPEFCLEHSGLAYRAVPQRTDNHPFRHKCVLFVLCVVLVVSIRFLLAFLLSCREDENGGDTMDVSSLPDMLRISKWGERGQGVKVDPFRLESTHRQEYEVAYTRYGYNQFLSDRISTRRHLPDVRPVSCRNVHYVTSSLPKASVVIVFKNVARSVLLRAVYSVLIRSSGDMLQEIVLVDYGSTVPELKNPGFEHYLSTFSKVKVHRLPQGHTLRTARVEAVKKTSATVIVFLSPRCEVTSGWLEPLLARFQGHNGGNSTIAAPVFDSIHYDTFQYFPQPANETAIFTWGWNLQTNRVLVQPPADITSPVLTPTLSHMIFAVDKEAYLNISAFDTGITNGNTLEFSLRWWMCRGHIEIVPCSRVGLLSPSPMYRGSTSDTEHLSQDQRIHLAHVWMAGWEQFVFDRIEGNFKTQSKKELPNLTSPKLGLCRDFRWYLQHVRPDLWHGDETILHRGWLRSIVWNDTVLQLGVHEQRIVLDEWYRALDTFWYFTEKGHVRTEFNQCLGTKGNSRRVGVFPCQDGNYLTRRRPSIVWIVRENGSSIQMIHKKSSLCLTRHKPINDLDAPTETSIWLPMLFRCQPVLPRQKWIFHIHRPRPGLESIVSRNSPKVTHENVLSDERESIRKMSIHPG